MKKAERTSKIIEILDKLFPNPDIPLKHKDPYTLLIAVLLSAQCTDARVNQVTPKLFALASTPAQMTVLKVEEIEEIIRPCGLAPKKSRAIWQLSKDLIDRHNGQVPNTLEELERFPGVGHKTASVVMIQAFGKPAFPVDTHIHRCAHRWGLSKGKTVEQTERDLKRLFAKDKWAKVHLQIIYYARTFCPAKGHNKEKCPICHFISNN
ncbi:MAG: endonuclease III [Chlamydiae bacterium CG10_big_fil_rev_8_21_14_0_10_42_34]|nr:MAG: endonuclease III [Chlamydiae bacterium CG10_big_fil_rev_8_21_14_0_10_42_34]